VLLETACFGAYRMHEQQERVTSMSYSVYSADEKCPDEMCRYSARQLHYHCNWVRSFIYLISLFSSLCLLFVSYYHTALFVYRLLS